MNSERQAENELNVGTVNMNIVQYIENIDSIRTLIN